jgi:hypothetical protein
MAIAQLDINLDNDVFDGRSNRSQELARIYRELASRIEESQPSVGDSFVVRDFNGNSVGLFEIGEETPCKTVNKFELVENMRKYGGNFVSKLADALIAADPQNAKRIIEAFPDIVEKYSE